MIKEADPVLGGLNPKEDPRWLIGLRKLEAVVEKTAIKRGLGPLGGGADGSGAQVWLWHDLVDTEGGKAVVQTELAVRPDALLEEGEEGVEIEVFSSTWMKDNRNIAWGQRYFGVCLELEELEREKSLEKLGKSLVQVFLRARKGARAHAKRLPEINARRQKLMNDPRIAEKLLDS